MTNKVSLVRIEGPTSIHIDAEITDKRDLLYPGQDVGDTPREVFGDSDYEYWLLIKARDKDQALLAIIEKLYSGNPKMISEVQEYLRSRGIPCEFHSYA